MKFESFTIKAKDALATAQNLARPLKRCIQRLLLDPLTDVLLATGARAGQTVVADADVAQRRLVISSVP